MQYAYQRQSCSASQICTYLYIQGVIRLSIKVALSIPVRAVEQGNECAVDHEPSVPPGSAGVFFDPFLCLLLFFSSWKADDLLHEFRTQDGSHDSARRKDDGTRSDTSPMGYTTDTHTVSIPSEAVQRDCNLHINWHLHVLGCVGEDRVVTRGFDKTVEGTGGNTQLSAKFIGSLEFQDCKDMWKIRWTPGELIPSCQIAFGIYRIYCTQNSSTHSPGTNSDTTPSHVLSLLSIRRFIISVVVRIF